MFYLLILVSLHSKYLNLNIPGEPATIHRNSQNFIFNTLIITEPPRSRVSNIFHTPSSNTQPKISGSSVILSKTN